MIFQWWAASLGLHTAGASFSGKQPATSLGSHLCLRLSLGSKQPVLPEHCWKPSQLWTASLISCATGGSLSSRWTDLSCATVFLKNSQTSAGSRKVVLASMCCVPLTEWPQAQHCRQIWICINLVNNTSPTLWLLETPPHAIHIPPEVLSVAGTFWAVGRGQQAWGYPVTLAEWPQALYWWQLTFILNMDSPTCLQAQHKQLTIADCFVVPIR